MFPDFGPDLGRMGNLGRAELANALFNGNAYTAYGEGQQSPQQQGVEQPAMEQPQQQNDGRSL
jgi:hypothetical protein